MFIVAASLTRLTNEDSSCSGDDCEEILSNSATSASCTFEASQSVTVDAGKDLIFNLARLWLTVPSSCLEVTIDADVTLSLAFDEDTQSVSNSYPDSEP